LILGIDLGTTNSAAAVFRDGAAVLVPNRLGSVLTPSAVSLEGDKVLVGLAARERQATHAASTATAFKRYMGTDRRLNLGGRQFSAEELSALVLRSLKEDAEAFLGEQVREAVITVPAYFNDRQRRATRRAGELAGLKVERLINEPTAAALAYGIHQLGSESRFLVFDLGGGTFDVSILEMFEGVIEVRSTTGDNRLGGEDFNELLIDMARKRFSDDWGVAARADETLYQKMREQAERARRALTTEAAATMRVVWRDRSYELQVDAEAFDAEAAPLMARLREPVLRAMRDAAIDSAALNEIVMIGGATRMPLVRKAVTRMFGRFPNVSVNPDEAVALGAAIQAGLKARDAALREVVLTDVCPYSMGIDIARHLENGRTENGLFSPIIERNTTIPASRVRTYQTLRDNQPEVHLTIYQGEARMVVDNIKIGEMRVPMRPGPAGSAFDVRFSYDINGLLEVDVEVRDGGAKYQLVVTTEGEETDHDLPARRAALAALKVHPRDTEAGRAAMARAERCWSDTLGHEREMIEQLIRRFEAALATQNPRTAEAACQELHAALDRFEGVTLP
jgi:molecular chaperone HscC